MRHDRRSFKGDGETAGRVQPVWRPTRRQLLRTGALAGGGFALGGAASLVPARGQRARAAGPKAGGKLTITHTGMFPLAPQWQSATTFDPAGSPYLFMGGMLTMLVYDRLVRVGGDGSPEPELAERWEVSEDGLTYTFFLRDAVFHDGSPVTADDVVYSIERGIASQAYPRFPAVKLEGRDAKTVVAHLDNPWAPFLADLTHPVTSVIPRHLHEEQKLLLFEQPVGSGPFTFVSWERGTRIELAKNSRYWESGKPYLDSLTLLELWDPAERLARFQDGTLDLATGIDYADLATIGNDSTVSIMTDGPTGTNFGFINTSRPPFDDKTLRQAINYAIDREAIVAQTLAGFGAPATSFLPPGVPARDASTPGYSFDLAKAKALVAQSAGKDGFTLELLTGVPFAQLVADQIAQIGGTVHLAGSDADWGALLQANKFDMWIDWLSPNIVDPDDVAAFLVHPEFGLASFFSHYQNPRIGGMLIDAVSTTDVQQRTDDYRQLQAILTEDAPVILLHYPGGQTATRSFVHDVRVLPTGMMRLTDAWRDDA